MTQRYFHSLKVGEHFRYLLRDRGIYIKRSLDIAELVTLDGRSMFYFAPDAQVLLLPTPEDKP